MVSSLPSLSLPFHIIFSLWSNSSIGQQWHRHLFTREDSIDFLAIRILDWSFLRFEFYLVWDFLLQEHAGLLCCEEPSFVPEFFLWYVNVGIRFILCRIRIVLWRLLLSGLDPHQHLILIANLDLHLSYTHSISKQHSNNTGQLDIMAVLASRSLSIKKILGFLRWKPQSLMLGNRTDF